MAGHAYKAAVDELDSGVTRELVSGSLGGRSIADPSMQDVPYRATVLEPVGKFASYFPTVNSAIDKRNNKVS